MPTPMPGSPDDELFVVPNILGDLASNMDRLSVFYQDHTQQELDQLGKELVPILKRNTPVASGRLAKSTHHRVVRTVDEESGTRSWELQLIQDALANIRSKVADRYFYWYTVHHGLKPAGRLRRVFPPFMNLLPWVIKKFGRSESTSKKKARSIAYGIYQEGIPPNPYIVNTYRRNEHRIQATADRIGEAMLVDLLHLPEVVR